MDTQQRKKEVYRFIVLVPHRDSLRPLEEYRASLFAAGFFGAWSFPVTAPLASVSRFFSVDELKELGRNIRELTKKTGGKIQSEGSAVSKLTTEEERRPLTSPGVPLGAAQGHGDREDFSFFGPRLNFFMEESLFPLTARARILSILSPPVVCAALVDSKSPPPQEGPALSFRAASLTNLAIRPLESGAAGYSFEWKMGPLIWLPKA